MIDAIRRANAQYGFFAPGDRVLVAVSGGADSCALLLALLELRGEFGLSSVRACHFNHGLRGDASDRDEEAVRALCARKGVPLYTGQGHMASLQKPAGESVESWARKLRYAFFERTAEPGELIALAHNRNDSVETVLFHLARGTGLRGLCGIPARRGRYVRPLIEATRAQIEAYCAQQGIEYCVDETNEDVRYARNRIRKNILPQLAMINAGAVNNIARMCAQARELEQFCARETERLLQEASLQNGWSVETLASADPVIVRFSLKKILESAILSVDEELICRAQAVLAGEYRRTELTAGLFFSRCGGVVTIQRTMPFAAQEAQNSPCPVSRGRNQLTSGESFEAEWSHFEPAGEKNLQKGLNNSADCDKIIGKLVFRTRLAGDSYRPVGRGVTKTLKKLFNEAKVPCEERARIPVVCDQAGIVWVKGFGVCDRVAVGQKTSEIVTFH